MQFLNTLGTKPQQNLGVLDVLLLVFPVFLEEELTELAKEPLEM